MAFDRKVYVREWVAKNKAKVRASQREHYLKRKGTEEFKQMQREIAKRYAERHPDRIKARNRKNYLKYKANGVDTTSKRREKKYAEATRPRPEVCEVCGGNRRWLCFDHNHATGKFRGWICDRCNMVLGHVKDDVDILMKLADYLRREGNPE